MAIIEITRAENVRRYTRYTLDTDALTPDQLAYIDGDGSAEQIYEPVDDDGDATIEHLIKEEGTQSRVDHGDCDDRVVTYIITGLESLDD